MSTELETGRYIVVDEVSPHKLTATVSGLVRLGWQPAGGVAVTFRQWTDRHGDFQEEWTYTQALWQPREEVKRA